MDGVVVCKQARTGRVKLTHVNNKGSKNLIQVFSPGVFKSSGVIER